MLTNPLAFYECAGYTVAMKRTEDGLYSVYTKERLEDSHVTTVSRHDDVACAKFAFRRLVASLLPISLGLVLG